MNTDSEYDFVNSNACDHFSYEEKILLLEKFSSLKSLYKKYKEYLPQNENITDYHKILKANKSDKILVVGGEGKSIYNNVKTLNLEICSNANIIADIDRTNLDTGSFDIIFFERVGFSESFYSQFTGCMAIDATINSIAESHRLLKSSGRLIILTGILFHYTIKYLLSVSNQWDVGKNFYIDKKVPIHFYKR